MVQKRVTKTRNLSVAEYFMQLQKEYILAEFRRKIYYNPRDKAYWQRVAGYKRERIEQIARRNGLKSIFTSPEKMSAIREQLFSIDGKPLFTLTSADRSAYYAIGNEYAYNGDIYILDAVDDNTGKIHNLGSEQQVDVALSDICRIL